MWNEKKVIFLLIGLSWLLFLAILLCFLGGQVAASKVSHMTIDMAYKALENFIYLSIAGVFLFTQIEDYTS
jgi:hypothetical protein